MTRRQAENLAKGNPRVAERLARGEYDVDPGKAPGSSREKPPARARKKAIASGAPPGRPRARSSSPRETPGTSTRAPRRSRDNGDDKPPGIFRSLFDGLFDI